MYALLLPDDVQPKGAVVVCAGGDHGACSLPEGYQNCLDFLAMGYQAFMLNNRPNHNPWSEKECGADAARAIRIIRRDAEKYRIDPHSIAFAGYSNGGVTGEACILHYSGEKRWPIIFPAIRPMRWTHSAARRTLSSACTAPVRRRLSGLHRRRLSAHLFAVGREDNAMDNLHATYPDLIAHGVPVEVHTLPAHPTARQASALWTAR